MTSHYITELQREDVLGGRVTGVVVVADLHAHEVLHRGAPHAPGEALLHHAEAGELEDACNNTHNSINDNNNDNSHIHYYE